MRLLGYRITSVRNHRVQELNLVTAYVPGLGF